MRILPFRDVSSLLIGGMMCEGIMGLKPLYMGSHTFLSASICLSVCAVGPTQMEEQQVGVALRPVQLQAVGNVNFSKHT